MKKIVAVNTSPRPGWNTSTLVQEAARGAQEQGAQVEMIDLYRLKNLVGCVSCFGCKREPNRGRCVLKDSIGEVLQKIREADGLILGTANYLGSATAGFHALYERLIFQSLTYNREHPCCNHHLIPVLFIMTSNADESAYQPELPYGKMLASYQSALNSFVGPTEILVYGNTLQVDDYSRYDWTLFDPEEKKRRRQECLPQKKQQAYAMGAKLG